MLCYMLLLCYVMLKYIFLYHNILYSYFFSAEQGRFEHHPASKDRTHMDPHRTRHKDVVFANGGGGGGLRPPPTPLPPRLSFQAVQACVQEHHTMNKTCTKHKTVLELFTAHLTGILFAKAGCVIVLWYIML